MRYENSNQLEFFSEISAHQINSCEFFSFNLLNSLQKNFGLTKVLISYFDTSGEFLSWVYNNEQVLDNEKHPYRKFASNDVIKHSVFQDAVRDHLTYFNVRPRLYKSTDIISPIDYHQSAYVRYLEENFSAHYSVTMAFGINAYIQISFFKSKEAGDFTSVELNQLEQIYIYIANSYKNFKKLEQVKIISNIQNEVIKDGEKAYFITDNFMNMIKCNDLANSYIQEMMGISINDEVAGDKPCTWLPFLIGSFDQFEMKNMSYQRTFKNFEIKVTGYEQSYSNGIIDRYLWVTISKMTDETRYTTFQLASDLTKAEQKVAELMYNGLTYKSIADELMVSYHTIKKHVQNIYTKCDVNSRYELYKWIELKNMK